MHVLSVDDDADVRGVLAAVLASETGALRPGDPPLGPRAGALRRFGRAPMDPDTIFLDHHVEPMLAEPGPTSGPARIIDLAAARVRLRA